MHNHRTASYALPRRRAHPASAEISLLHGALFLTILISPFVFVEPSPYEAAAAILTFCCIVAPVAVDRKLLPLILLLVLWIVGGLIAVIPVVYKDKTVQFAAVSVFLAFTAFVYACLFAQDCMRDTERSSTMSICRGFSSMAGPAE